MCAIHALILIYIDRLIIVRPLIERNVLIKPDHNIANVGTCNIFKQKHSQTS